MPLKLSGSALEVTWLPQPPGVAAAAAAGGARHAATAATGDAAAVHNASGNADVAAPRSGVAAAALAAVAGSGARPALSVRNARLLSLGRFRLAFVPMSVTYVALATLLAAYLTAKQYEVRQNFF